MHICQARNEAEEFQAKKKRKKEDIIPRKYNVIVANNVPRTFTSRRKEEKP